MKHTFSHFKKFLTLPLLLFIITSIVYLTHLSLSVYGGDSGDFISAALTVGVPHPSGYPLFVLLGILANALPLGMTPAWRIGLISVFASSGSVVLMYLLIHKLTKSMLLSLITALTLAFFYLFWLYAEVVEVFSLNNFLFLLLLFFSLKYKQTLQKRFVYLGSIFLGLSFTNHEITILLVPSLFIIVFSANWKLLMQWKTMLLSVILFAIGLLPYLYIPLAASRHPLVNWDNASTLQNFLHLVLRKDYNWSLNTQTDMVNRFLAVQAFTQRLFIELTPAGSVLILLGMVEMLRKKMFALFSALFVGFFLTGPFYVVYGLLPLINDFSVGILERFYLISSLFLIIFLPFGIRLIVTMLDSFFTMIVSDKKRRKAYQALFMAIFLIIPVMLFRLNYEKTDLHKVLIGDYLGEDLLSPIPEKSLLVLTTDNVFFNAEYIHIAKGVKKDVTVSNLVYLPRDPIFLAAQAQIHQKSLSKVDKDYQTMLNINFQYPIYTWANFQLSKDKNKQFTWIPFGLGYKIADQNDLALSEDDFLTRQENFWQNFHIPFREELSPAERGLTIANIPAVYAAGYANTAGYLRSHYKDYEKAKEYYQKSVAVDNGFEAGYLGLGYIDAILHDCEEAKNAFENVIGINPAEKQAYISLFVLSNTCLHDDFLSKQMVQTFTKLFGGSIQKETLKVLSGDSSTLSQ